MTGPENLDFVAIDVETANADCASICQVGIVKYREGQLVREWSSFINPQTKFGGMNISIHGISEDDVAGSPTFPEVKPLIDKLLNNDVCVHHTYFDRTSIREALKRYRMPDLNTMWLDCAKVAQIAWPECAQKGYGLSSLCEKIGYSFRHHDALEDAKACAQVLLAAVKATGLNIDAWLRQVSCPIGALRGLPAETREGRPEGPLYGEVVVFTGALKMPRPQAVALASAAGCAIQQNVTNQTTLLVVGEKVAGREKSAKHRKAEQLIGLGKNAQ